MPAQWLGYQVDLSHPYEQAFSPPKLEPLRKFAPSKSNACEPRLTPQEAIWFMSLPEKVQRQCFTREERILIRTGCETVLSASVASQTYTCNNADRNSPLDWLQLPLSPTVVSDDRKEDKTDGINSEQLLACTVLDDYRNSYSGQFSLSSHCSDIACTSERTAYYPHKHGHPRRIKNFSLPSSYTTDADRASLRTASWPPDDILYQEDLGSSTSPTRFYHDPDARAKLRQYIATPQDFDEALAERETTFRMTLTRPGLRSMNELRRWQQQDSSRSESNPDEDSDPLALEPLPFSDDTNGAQGHFAASDPEGKGIRKVWKLLNRRSSAASRSS